MTGRSEPPGQGGHAQVERARREAREAAALRENLRRRKQQARARTANDGRAPDPEASRPPPVADEAG
ncbi:hypothetical protein FE263_09280 [Lichenicoccus roseus]|uniref:Uncharacterized protein n=1 Tax=Lichenicoccus roseus TaxID=2683649 RepID=A0A5R9J979_9PROT|nr:hypothetical protein FE263_09280 [Lichenicoccus roseus]